MFWSYLKYLLIFDYYACKFFKNNISIKLFLVLILFDLIIQKNMHIISKFKVIFVSNLISLHLKFIILKDMNDYLLLL